MKISCLIPARSGSRSVPDKNILPLGLYPLIAYSIAAAKLSKYIDDVVVSTDSEKYAATATSFGADVPFIRPKKISQDHSLDIEFFQHYLGYLKDKSSVIPDLIVHLRPTTPLREVGIIDNAIDYMIKNKRASALRSMHNTHLTPYKMFKVKNNYAVPFLSFRNIKEFYNLPRQVFEDAYIPNGYVDIIKPAVIMNEGLLHGNRIKIWITEEIPDIDILSDYEHACKMLEDPRFKPLIRYMNSMKNA
jgi:N-acylneuraminate cytidylyltransferase